MPTTEINANHIYLLLDCHQAPKFYQTLSATRLRAGLDLLKLGWLQEVEGRWHPTVAALEKIDAFGNSLKEGAPT